ncbi:YpiF family protein [Peribacillus alkalitolerans]|uniref:YpiF family protein n=1 Tax=Peribacillus alkalitolerans TaxID=1550385 RepID=UPI0013D459CC|nr:YpiF family protein [Peribacillus alkalitolerans]
MKWIAQDVDLYSQSKEYVDTVLIPLSPLSFGAQMKQFASMHEFNTILTNEIERQFKGRLFLFPAATYFPDWQKEKKIEYINEWTSKLSVDGVKHVFFITSDPDWKQIEPEIKGTLIWSPYIPMEHVEDKYKRSMMEDQVRQLLHIFIQKWRQ